MKSGNQEQICVKLDKSVLAALELEHGVSGIPRNRVINRALVAYTQLLDMMRSYKAGFVSESEFDNWFRNVYSVWLSDRECPMSFIVNRKVVKSWK